MPRKQAFVLLLIAAAGLVCYGGPGILRLGFYHDDWALLSALHFSPPGLSAMIAQGVGGPFRPLLAVAYAVLFRLFGLRPLGWQCALLAVNVALSWTAFRLMRRYGVADSWAALAALLFLAYPSKDATMFWPSNLPANDGSLLAFLGALLFQLDYAEGGRKRSLAAALVLWLVCLATYDQSFFLCALWLVTPDGWPPERRARAVRGSAAAAGILAAFAFYKFFLVSRLFRLPYNKTFVLSLGRFWYVFHAGLAAMLGPELLRYTASAAAVSVRTAPLMACAAALIPWLLLRLKDEEPSRGPRRMPALTVLGTGIVLLGYFPIVVSDYYVVPFNHMNRINQVPVLGMILAAAGVLGSAPRPRAWKAAGCALASMLLMAHVTFAGYWAESYRRQMLIRDMVVAHQKEWPSGAVLLLLLRDHFIASQAPVFLAPWDITGATRLWTQDSSRAADVVDQKFDFRPDGVHNRGNFWPYARVVLLDADHGSLTRIRYRDMARLP